MTLSLSVVGNEPDSEFPFESAWIYVPELSGGARIPLSPGLHVLYGLNGVGKSRVLSALPEAVFTLRVPLDPEASWETNTPGSDEAAPSFSARIWTMPRFWSFGHESDLHWDGKSDDTRHFAGPRGAAHLREVLEDPFWEDPTLVRYPGERGPESPRRWFNDWMLRIGYWIAHVNEFSPEDRRVVADAIAQILLDGRVQVRLANARGSRSHLKWRVSVDASISPDSGPIFNYLSLAADRSLAWWETPENIERFEAAVAGETDDAVTDLAYEEALNAYEYPFGQLLEYALVGEIQGRLLERYTSLARDRYVLADVFWWETDFGGWNPIRVVTDDDSRLDEIVLSWLRVELSPDLDEDGEKWSFLSEEAPNSLHRRARSDQVDQYIFGPPKAPQISAPARRAAAQLSEMTTSVYRSLLATGTEVRIRLTEPGEWPLRPRVAIEALDDRKVWVNIDALSDTQRRLATLAVKLSAADLSAGVTVLTLDEPERGLHRLAELHLRAGLVDLTKRIPNLVVIVASHSPAFLRPDLAKLHHVRRDHEGSLELASLDGTSIEGVADLGMSPVDLLQLTRVIVLVEGANDEWVLNALYAEEFRRMGVRVMSMRGATKLIAAAEGQLLFDYTEAHLVVMLDNVSNERANARWNEAVVLHSEGSDFGTIDRVLQKLLPRRKSVDSPVAASTESAALRDFCLAALKNNRQDRITFSTLGLGDIEFYLDPKHFLTDLARNEPVPTWNALLAEHKEAKKQPGTKNFKTWLAESGRAKWNQARWERAVAALDEIPEDLAEVYRTIERLHLMLK